MFEKAASQEISTAYFNLALCYELGLGVSSPNLSKSREYLQKAIEKDYNIIAQSKGLDNSGKWTANVPATQQNGQSTYEMRWTIAPEQMVMASLTWKTNNNIIERTLVYEKMDNKIFRLNLPSIIAPAAEGSIAQTKKPEPVLPSIRIITPFNNASFNNGKTSFTYYADTPEDAPVLGVTVKINDRVQSIKQTVESDGSIELNLPQTDCNVTFVVRNKYGNSPEEVVNLKWKTPEEFIIKPNLYVLAIGINEYENFTPLQLPVKDMTDFVSIVNTKKNKPYRDIKIKTLQDKDATRQNIEEAFLWLTDEVTTIDFTFIYFAGHGTLDDKNRFYLVPVDGHRDKLPTTCIRGNHFIDMLNDVPGKVIVFTDACHSGSLTEEGTRSASEADIGALVDLMHNAKNGVALYASSESENVSRENPEWGNGAFTKVLLQAFRGETKIGDKKELTTQDLIYYLNDGVHKVAKKQKPKFDVKENFPLFLY